MRIFTVPRLVFVIAAAVIAASMIAGFRGEDWFNIERGANSLADLPATLLATHTPGFYRPLPDLVTGVMYRSFGLTPAPYIALLLLLFAIDAGLLAAIVRARGGTPAAAWIAVAVLGVQANTYAWTVFWFSYITGSLVTTLLLLAVWLHHRAVERAESGRGPGPAIPLVPVVVVLAGMCKEEVVLLPLLVAALEWVRWRRLSPAGRRAALASGLAIAIVVGVYAVFRLAFHPPDIHRGTAQYRLAFGTNWIANAAFFGFHLLPLPVAIATLTGWSAWRARGRASAPAWPGSSVRAELLAGAAWLVLSIQLYLPMGGHAYGLLYLPAFGVALGLAPWLATRSDTALRLTIYAGFAALVTGWGLVSIGWPRYRTIARDTFTALDRASPTPPHGARFLFLDPMEETLAGRSLFNMVFDGAVPSMVRLHYRRPDLGAGVILGPAALDSAAHPPVAQAVFLVRAGRLERVDRGAQLARRPVP